MTLPPSFAGLIGVARRDVTPPVGIYARSWGAATQDVAEGIHRPLVASVLTFQDRADGRPLILASIDAGWYRDPDSESFIRQYVLSELGLNDEDGASRVMIALTHTHAACSISMFESDKPGGHLIRPYMETLRSAIVDAAREALASAQPALLTCAYGLCSLATNRDLPDPDSPTGRIVCGYFPDAPADDTLLVGRVTRDSDNRVIATIVNYACHPTMLAWTNRLISPDYVGAMREIVEASTSGAPCLFTQGASGELGPAMQHSNDLEATERAGRMLGHSVMATLESMLPPRQVLDYTGVVESGAPLAVWQPAAFEPPRQFAAQAFDVAVPLKNDLPTESQVREQMQTCADRAMAERLRRKLNVLRIVGPGPTAPRKVWAWRVGSIVLLGQADEAYSDFQLSLRRTWPDHALVIMHLVNGSCGYLAPSERYDHEIYQVWQSPFARGCLELMTSQCRERIAELLQ